MLRYLAATALIGALGLAATPAFAYKIFVSNEKGNDVTVLSSENFEVTDTFPVGQRPRGIAVSPDGTRLYVCTSDDDTIKEFDTKTYEFIRTLPSGRIRNCSSSRPTEPAFTRPMRTTISSRSST